MQVEIKRKREYTVNIEETLIYSVNIEAVDEEEASEIVAARFHDGDLILEDGERTEARVGVNSDGWVTL